MFRMFVIFALLFFYFKLNEIEHKIDQLSTYNDQLGISIEKMLNQ